MTKNSAQWSVWQTMKSYLSGVSRDMKETQDFITVKNRQLIIQASQLREVLPNPTPPITRQSNGPTTRKGD